MDIPGYIRLTLTDERRISIRYANITAFTTLTANPDNSMVFVGGSDVPFDVLETVEEIADYIDTQIMRDRQAG